MRNLNCRCGDLQSFRLIKMQFGGWLEQHRIASAKIIFVSTVPNLRSCFDKKNPFLRKFSGPTHWPLPLNSGTYVKLLCGSVLGDMFSI